MPRTRSLAFSELKVGLLALTAIVVAAAVIFMLSGTGGFFWQRYQLKVRFPDVSGLKEGAPVRVAGVEVGTVTSIRFVGAEVEVVFNLSRAMQPRVTTSSVAALGTLSLLGQSTVDISAASTGTPLEPWAYVTAGRLPGQISDVAATASKGLEETAGLLRDLRAGRGTVGRLFTDDSLYRDFDRLLASTETVAANLKAGRGTVGRLLADSRAYDELVASLDSVNAVLRRIDAGEGSLGRLIRDDRFADSLTSATGSIDSLLGRLNRGEGSVGKLMTESELYERLNSFTERLDRIATRLDQGQGTAGQLLQDRQLYENMNGAASELRGLIGDIRQNPRKYLNVRVSVF